MKKRLSKGSKRRRYHESTVDAIDDALPAAKRSKRTETGEPSRAPPKPLPLTIECLVPGCDWQSNSRNARHNRCGHLRKKHPGYPNLECSYINCHERFITKEEKAKHMRNMHIQKDWCCSAGGCGRIFTDTKQRNKHRIEKHPDLTFLACLLKGCEILFTSEDDLQTHFRETHADRAIPCRIDNCSKVFLTSGSESAHQTADHSRETFDCMVVGCGEVFGAKRKLQKHMTKTHPHEPSYECYQQNCGEVFAKFQTMKAHMEEAHSEQQSSGHSTQCCFEDCEERFLDQSALFNHQRAEHHTHTCPHQDCSKAFRTQNNLQRHLLRIHNGKDFPCPWPGCGKVLGSESAHKNVVFKCAYPSCKMTFTTKHCLSNHIDRKHPGMKTYNNPCPAAELESCHHMFSSPRKASKHANMTHRGKIPCLHREEFSCNVLFEDTLEARLHARNVHSRYMCNVQGQGCMSTIMGHVFSKRGYRRSHVKIHMRDPNISCDSLPEPQLKIVSGTIGMDEMDSNVAEDDLDHGDPGSDYTAHSINKFFPFAHIADDIKHIEAYSISVQQRNEQLIREFPQATRNNKFFGLKCAGPSPIVNKIVTTICPNGTTLDYKTARIKIEGQGQIIRLPLRCIECQTSYTFQYLIEKHMLLEESETQICSGNSCFQPSFRQSRLCQYHLSSWTASSTDHPDYTNLIAPALAITWVADEPVRCIFDLLLSIQAGRTDESELRFLDLEFNSSTKRVFEIGMCDFKGNITLDCRTRYQLETYIATTTGRGRADAYMDLMIERSTARHYCKDSRMSARQVADRLREQGVSPKTWFVTWHLSPIDLSVLRGWLESEGQFNVLPDNSRCLPILSYFRSNLKAAPRIDGRTLPGALGILFPLFMSSQHELAGKNHHAAVDAQQAYYLTEVYLMQHRCPADRPEGWLKRLQKPRGSLGRQQQRQQTIESLWQKAKRYLLY